MCRSGFKFIPNEPEVDSGKCFSLIRESEYSVYEVILGNIVIHPNLIFNMSIEALQSYILGKLNKGRCFGVEYDPQFEDELRVCVSIERNLDFYFRYEYEGWNKVSNLKASVKNGKPNFVSQFGSTELAKRQVS